MVSSNRCRDLISLQQYSPESKCSYCLLGQKWGCGYNQSLPGFCYALTDLYPGINSIFQWCCWYFSEHEHRALKVVRHFLSIPLFITLVRGQKSVCFTNIRIYSCLWAFIREQRNTIKVSDTENTVVNNNVSSGLRILSFCRKMTPASQSQQNTAQWKVLGLYQWVRLQQVWWTKIMVQSTYVELGKFGFRFSCTNS